MPSHLILSPAGQETSLQIFSQSWMRCRWVIACLHLMPSVCVLLFAKTENLLFERNEVFLLSYNEQGLWKCRRRPSGGRLNTSGQFGNNWPVSFSPTMLQLIKQMWGMWVMLLSSCVSFVRRLRIAGCYWTWLTPLLGWIREIMLISLKKMPHFVWALLCCPVMHCNEVKMFSVKKSKGSTFRGKK